VTLRVAPAVLAQWLERYLLNAALYQVAAQSNCSVDGHQRAAAFAKFVQQHAIPGPILDIGCGPQVLPSYLAWCEVERITGLDPLPGRHPFPFWRGLGEQIPAPTSSFPNLITATSLDHVLDLGLVLAELARVTAPGGRWFNWETYCEEAPPYDPTDPQWQPADSWHVFRLGPWFRPLLDSHWLLCSEQAYGADTFECWERRA
jgi:hypothetical protein